MRNKRGWIRIVEAFAAFLLIAGVVLFLINRGYFGGSDISEKVYDFEKGVLRDIELNNAYRQYILGIENVPSTLAEGAVKDYIDKNKPSNLECSAVVCKLELVCSLDPYPPEAKGDIYAQSVAITATTSDYKPRQIKLFCWVK